MYNPIYFDIFTVIIMHLHVLYRVLQLSDRG